MGEEKPMFLKELRLGTILVSIIGSLIVLCTPYKMEVYSDVSRSFYFFPVTIFPVLIICLTLIVTSSFLAFRKANTRYEIIMIVSSLLGIPSLILSDATQVILSTCTSPKIVYLSALYVAFPFFIFSAVWGSYLFVRKRSLLAQI
jgi:ABC-type tungstate transport system substrate-binding protein